MRHKKHRLPNKEPGVPRQVCILHHDGERLYAIPYMWQSMHEFLKDKAPFAIDAERKLNLMPGAEKFREEIWAQPGAVPNTLSVGNSLWGLNDVALKPHASLRVVVTLSGPKAFAY